MREFTLRWSPTCAILAVLLFASFKLAARFSCWNEASPPTRPTFPALLFPTRPPSRRRSAPDLNGHRSSCRLFLDLSLTYSCSFSTGMGSHLFPCVFHTPTVTRPLLTCSMPTSVRKDGSFHGEVAAPAVDGTTPWRHPFKMSVTQNKEKTRSNAPQQTIFALID